MLLEHRGKTPQVDPSAYVAPNAIVCGDVRIGPDARVLFGAVLTAEDGCGRGRGALRDHGERPRPRPRAASDDDRRRRPDRPARPRQRDADREPAASSPPAPRSSRARVWARAARSASTASCRSTPSLEPGTTVPIGWIAVGDPAQILPPDRHDDIWAIQRELDFPGTVYGIPRGTDATTMMRGQAEWFGAHREDAEA